MAMYYYVHESSSPVQWTWTETKTVFSFLGGLPGWDQGGPGIYFYCKVGDFNVGVN